jgi:hypothetical protein
MRFNKFQWDLRDGITLSFMGSIAMPVRYTAFRTVRGVDVDVQVMLQA